jgi:1-acyl-sn-glycerol-3-phosphate acyltransferase
MAGPRYPVYTLAKLVVPPVIRFWVRLDCQGLLNIPREGPVIIAANHISYFDPLCLGTFIDAAGRQVRFLAKSELYRNPVLGAILRGAGQIPVYRETRDAGQALVHAVAAMREGASGARISCSPGASWGRSGGASGWWSGPGRRSTSALLPTPPWPRSTRPRTR